MEQGERRMTKEELEREVTEYLNTQTLPKIDSLVYRVIKNLIFGFAEPREKQIEELKKENERLQNLLNHKLRECRRLLKKKHLAKEQVAELEAQIEKMKSDVKQLREDRMNYDTDQNIMDRLWEEWTINFGVSNQGDKRKMINTKTKGELGRRIEYDVEHDLFHPQNIYSDEYITPTFIEYVQKLEEENAELKAQTEKMKCCYNCKHSRTEYEHCKTDKHEKWEIKEK